MAVSSVVEFGPDDDADEVFYRKGYCDGLPVVLPTRLRVMRMLCGTSLAPTDVLGKCPPSYSEVTVEKLAIAAVMAGCTPEMFRLVVAATRAFMRPEFGLHGVHATTMGATPVVVVNGPCRDPAGVNYKHAPCGSGNRSTSIGRALKLLLQNVGRAKLGGTESTTIGTPMKFGMCFAEWEERCGQWEPLSVSQGCAERDQDAVTVFAATSGPVQLVDQNSGPKELLQRLGKSLASAYSPQFPFVNNCLLIVSPEHYDTFVKGGFNSKKDLSLALWRETSKHMLTYIPGILVTLGRMRAPRVPSIFFWAAGALLALVGMARRLLGAPLTAIPKFSGPESFQIVVAGGDAGKFSSFMPGFGVGKAPMPTANMSRPVTELVEPRPVSLDSLPTLSAVGAGASEILDPSGELPGARLTLARRTGQIPGPVALMDISKSRGSELLDFMEKRLRAQGLETRRYSKPTFSRPCPEELRRSIAAECGSVILGLAD